MYHGHNGFYGSNLKCDRALFRFVCGGRLYFLVTVSFSDNYSLGFGYRSWLGLVGVSFLQHDVGDGERFARKVCSL